MENYDRPVPAPRRTGVGQSSTNPSENCSSSAFVQLNNNVVPSRPINGNSAEAPKPKPKPRNFIERLTSEKRKSKKSEKDIPLSVENENYEEAELTDEMKRGTVNLFQVRRNRDPFDIEFEKSLNDAELLSNVTFSSPLEDLPRESRTSFAHSVSSSNSNSTDDYYVQPPPPQILVSNQTSLISTSSPSASTHNAQTNAFGETNNSYLDTEENESIYEPISSYSSASSGSGPTMNEYSSLPVTANNIDNSMPGHRPILKRSTVPMVGVGINGHTTESKDNSLGLISKSRYQRLQDERHSHASSTSADENLERNENGGSTNNHAEIETSNLCRSPSNVSGKSNKEKFNSNEYDDVTVENGNVVFLDNLENTVTRSTGTSSNNTNSSSSIASRNSVVMEFDPLFETSKASRRTHNKDIGKDIPPHRYELVEGSDVHDGVKEEESQLVAITPTPSQNSEYFPIDGSVVKKTDSMRSCSDEEPGSPISDLPSNSKFRKSQSPKKSKDDDKNQETDENGREVATSSGQASFLRRLSNRIRLGPIREEISKSLPSTTINAGPVVVSCNKCCEEHPEGTKCTFTLCLQPDVVYSSNLFKPAGIKKEFTKRFVFLSHGKLSFQNEKSVVTDEVSLEKIGVVCRKDDRKAVANKQELHCFVMYFISGKSATLNLGAATEAERCLWMQKYIETFSTGFPASVISSYDRGGWCFLKEGVTSNWIPCWFVLKDRVLVYCLNGSSKHMEMDLRKARAISLNAMDSEHTCPYVENSDVLTMDISHKIFYVQTENVKLTSGWAKAIQEAAKRNGPNFEEMQLSADNVPVIVEKCIDFLYVHGTLAEGIYRHSGSNSRITQLLADFQKDAWAVQLSPKDYSAHDVAGTLKRFFRTLPEPLVTAKLYEEWIQASGIQDSSNRMEAYDRLLEEVPLINYNTLKKLVCHLYAVHEVHEKNLMPLVNLAPIWGPTLMNVDNSKLAESASAPSYKIACAECEVVKDLIENYYTLFHVNPQERDKEKKMQDALEIYHLGSMKRKCSGDIKLFIYILEKDESTAINITLSPTGTAYTVTQQLCRLAQIRNNDNLFLHEVICDGALERPLHPSEKVIETALRWSIWEFEERSNNYLILRRNTLYPELLPYAKDPKAVYGDMKFADSKTKTFKKYSFKFSNACLKYSKDTKTTAELGSWKIEDMVWYIGVEQRRTPPTKWSFTFIKRNYPFKRCKEEPFFGNVVSFNSQDELNIWIAAMVIAEHPAGLYPSVLV